MPTAPLKPRVFVSHKSSPLDMTYMIQAEFRWAAPEHPNGVIESHRIHCWFFKGNSVITRCRNVTVGGDALFYRMSNLLPNTTYYFQVGAATAVGDGPMSDVVQISTAKEHPVPKLLLAKMDAVKVTDVDLHQERLLSSKASHPIAIAYLGQDGRVFWLEEKGLLMASGLDGSNITVVHNLPFSGTSLTIDWVGRYLYWTETNRSSKQSSILMMDLNQGHNFYNILNSSMPISSVEVDPFSSTLIYTAVNNHGVGVLMTCNSDGSNPRRFFGRSSPASSGQARLTRRSRNDHCNCDPYASVGNAVTLDRSLRDVPQLLWIDGSHGHIWSADLGGCNCTLVVNATEMQNAGEMSSK